MPGRRNFARERAHHAATVAQRQSALYAQLRTELPDHDVALVGWPTILEHVNRWGLRRRNGGPVTRRILQRWARVDGFPLCRGNFHRTHRTPPLSSSHAILAWTLTQLHVGSTYRVNIAGPSRPPGSFAAHAALEHAA